MSLHSPYLVVINGAPGAGKTTLAKKLQKDLGIGLVAKDVFKEFLFDTLGTGDREWSFTVGREVIGFCYYFTKLNLLNNRSTIFESAFWAEHARSDMEALLKDTNVRAIEVYCMVAEEERLRRFNTRLENGERHIGHADSMSDAPIDMERYEPLDVCKRITVDTGNFDEAAYSKLVSSIKQFAEEE